MRMHNLLVLCWILECTESPAGPGIALRCECRCQSCDYTRQYVYIAQLSPWNTVLKRVPWLRRQQQSRTAAHAATARGNMRAISAATRHYWGACWAIARYSQVARAPCRKIWVRMGVVEGSPERAAHSPHCILSLHLSSK